jgi:hypothetical protein
VQHQTYILINFKGLEHICAPYWAHIIGDHLGLDHESLVRGNSSFRASWIITIIPGLSALFLCRLSKVIFLRRWMASMCWAAILFFSSNYSKVVSRFFNDWLSVRRDPMATLSGSTSDSMGSVASNPYTKEKKVACVVILKVVRYAHNAAVNFTSQSLLKSIIVLWRILAKVRLTCSVWPLVYLHCFVKRVSKANKIGLCFQIRENAND